MKNLFRTIVVVLAVAVVLPRNGFADFQKGIDAAQRGDYATAFKELVPLAERGDAFAQFNLGQIHSSRGDYNKALTFYQLAAGQGDVDSQVQLGVMYANGMGIPQDHEIAFKWFKLVVGQRQLYTPYKKIAVALAQFNLGILLLNGQGVSQDFKEAIKWFKLAAEQGEALSPQSLGLVVLKGPPINLAQYNLGLMYFHGTGVSQDYEEAIKWFKLAAEQGVVRAQYNLGLMYFHGNGVLKDDAEAFKWYELAAEQGHALSQYSLGVMYAKGIGAPKDSVLAHVWLNQIASKERKAARLLSTLEKLMTPAQIAEAQRRAEEWHEKH
jgi:uncharacterized protein